MERRPLAAVIAGLCGIAIGVGAFLPWIAARGSRPGSGINHTLLTGLLHWSYQSTSSFYTSVAVAVGACGLLVLIGALVGSRFLAGLFSLLALAVGGAWIVLNATHFSSSYLPYADSRLGAWLTLGGGLIGLIAAVLLRRPAR